MGVPEGVKRKLFTRFERGMATGRGEAPGSSSSGHWRNGRTSRIDNRLPGNV
ncbi:hypothetical protein [Methanoculleus sp.]|jgi:hypothetical protein|uniref:hypothetical protein n=1 Tax=Methanoculleus sp. TaxID=90427 RepID=UPI001BD3ADF4|nr:hypothetical protein [Methanoculleus sp.]